MRPLIDIHNYEAYYLDYLEGNLDAETSELLEMFLAEHPELAIDDDLPLLEPDMRIDPAFHLSLKREATEEITGENLEYFLIAELEGQLSVAQQEKLNAFMLLHPELEADRTLVRSLVLQPGDEPYAHKESLKKGGRIIPLWVKTAAAAAVVLLFTLPFIHFSGSELSPQKQSASLSDRPTANTPVKPAQSANSVQTASAPVRRQDGVSAAPDSRVKTVRADQHGNLKPANGRQPKEYQPHDTSVSGLPAKHIRTSVPELAAASQEKEAAPVIAMADATQQESRMENPIPVITRGVSEVFKTPVDVKTEKSAGRKGKGFYIRVGNVEVSRSASL